MTEDEEMWWRRQGYLAGKEIEAGMWIVLVAMLYTYRVMVCTPPPGGAVEFYCFPNLYDGWLAYSLWDGHGEIPVKGWTRHHGGKTSKNALDRRSA